jgi:hypothetical protein
MRASQVLAHAVAGALALVGGVVHAAEEEACAAWPGEMSPLPSVDDRDAFAARWAELRFAELSTVAESIAAMDPSAAHRLWQHARCLAPRDANIETRLAALVPRKEVVLAPVVARARPVPRPPARPKPERAQDLASVDARIDSASAALAQARFREALDESARARTLLESMGASAEVRTRQARLEVMAGTAALALDLEEEAALSLGRALRADPELALDDSTPPKVRRLFLAVRESLEKKARP